MRKILLSGMCLAALSGTAHAQGIIVNDPAEIALDLQDLIDEAKSYALQAQQFATENLMWTKQVAQYAMQAQQFAVESEQLLAFVHNPSLGGAMLLMNQTGLGSSMPVNPYALMGIVNGLQYGNGGMPEIQGILGSLSTLSVGAYGTAHIYSPTDGSWASQQLIANGNSIAGTQGTALSAYSDLKAHAAALQALRDHLATATTPKDVQDAQAQIELETTWTINQQAQITSLQATYATQQDSRIQRDEEKMVQSIDSELTQAQANGAIP